MNYKYSAIIIIILTVLYILFITKLADVLTIDLEHPDESYTMVLYIISIMALVLCYMYLNNDNNKGNYVLRNSINFGSVLILVYTMTNYWDYLGEYSKLSLLGACIFAIIYYIYKF